jgi:hypothetical protein
MIWMLPTTDRRSVRTLEYVTIAALVLWTLATAIALVDTNLTATINAWAAQA